MDFAEGFAPARPLGAAGDGGYLPFAALTAIHMAHRLGALVAVAALALLAWRLHAAAARRGAGRSACSALAAGRPRAGSATSSSAGRSRRRSRTPPARPRSSV